MPSYVWWSFGEIEPLAVGQGVFYLVPGRSPAEMDAVKRMVFQLSERGLRVHGVLVSPEEQSAVLEKARDHGEEIYEVDLNSDEETVPESEPELARRRFFSKALGLVKRPALPEFQLPSNPGKFSPQKRRAFLDTVISHNLITLAGQYLSGNLRALPTAVLTSYYAAYFSNLESILGFKGKGKVLRVKDGTVEVDVNASFVAAVNVFEELLINSLLDLALAEKFSAQEILERSLHFGITKTTVDRLCARLELQREKLLAAGEEKAAKGLEEQLFQKQIFFFNRFVPVMRSLVLSSRGSSYETYVKRITQSLQLLAAIPTVVDELGRHRGERELLGKSPDGCGKFLLLIRRRVSSVQ